MLNRIVAILLALAGLAPLAVLAAGPDDAGFDILEYVVEGNSVLSAPQIEAAVYSHMGEGKGIADVEAARTALEKAYHAQGYLTVFVDIPEQEVKTGSVRLRVMEGRVERQRVVGARFHAPGLIKAEAGELTEGQVPHFPTLQDQMQALNTTPDRRVTPVLRAGRAPGTVEAELKVADEFPLHASLEVNDRASAGTTPTRASAGLRYANLWQRQHSLLANVQMAPEKPDESQVFMLNYLWPLETSTLALYAVVSQSDVATLGGVNVLGEGRMAGLRYIRPLPTRPGLRHSLTLGADYKDFDETTQLEGADTGNTPVSYLPFLAGYDLTWGGQASRLQLGVNLHFHLDGLAADDAEFHNKRFNAQSGYLYLRTDLKGQVRLFPGLSLGGRLAAQFSADPLISNEQFGAGGGDTVRGYPESAALGDMGWVAGLELRGPDLGSADGWLKGLVPYLYVDGASLRVLDPLPGQDNRFTLSGAGLGVQFQLGRYLNGQVDWARALETLGDVYEGHQRWHFRLAADW